MSISAQDLRIGNWVFELEYVKVATIGKTGINVDSEGADIPFDCLVGIPLSPVILEVIGFERKSFVYDWFVLNLPKDYTLRLRYNAFPEFIPYIQNDSQTKLPLPSAIKYLHQLQNLFYSLTGEELTIDISLLQNLGV